MGNTQLNKNQVGNGIWTANNTPIIGSGAPTASVTALATGQHYLDSTTGEEYVCTDPNGGDPQANFTIISPDRVSDYMIDNPAYQGWGGIETGFAITTRGSWKIRTRFQSVLASYEANILGATLNNNYNRFAAGVYCGVYDNKFHLEVSFEDNSWGVTFSADNTYIRNDIFYWVEFGYDLATTSYFVDFSTDGVTYTRDTAVVSSGLIRPDTKPIAIGAMQSYNGFTGKIDLRNTAIYEDGVLKYTPYTFGGSAWQKTGTNFTKVSGYSSSGTQVLKNIDGVLTWVTES